MSLSEVRPLVTSVLSRLWTFLFLADAFGRGLAVAVRAVLAWPRRPFAFAISSASFSIVALTSGALVLAAFAGWRVRVEGVVRAGDLEL
jgi:hypothetical protein